MNFAFFITGYNNWGPAGNLLSIKFCAAKSPTFVNIHVATMLQQAIKYKKRIPVFLLLVIFMPLLVTLSLLVSRQIIHYQMLEKIESKNLTTLLIKKSNLQWIRKGKEIAVEGKLFDVKDISLKGNEYIVRGLYDEKEIKLAQLVKKMQSEPNRTPLHLLVSKIVSLVLFAENNTDWQDVAATQLSRKYPLQNTGNFHSYCPALIAPPPKV